MTDLRVALADGVAGPVTSRALAWLDELSETHESLLPMMAGRAEELAGDPEDAAQRAWVLIREILDEMGA